MRIEAAAIALLLGFVFDLIVGDPHSLWHPVYGIGWLIQKFEGLFRRIFPKSPLGERIGGTFTVIFVIVCTLIPPALLIFISYRIHFLLGILILDEVGCGLVPMDPFERQYREAVGRLGEQLAKKASEVYRMSCGLAQKLK